MVKKFSKATDESSKADNNLLHTVKESSSHIWLAGLGAFSKAQEEGSKVFEALVKEGTGLQKKFRNFADSQVSDVTNEVSGKITEATSKAAGAWDRLETVFEDRVGRAVGRLGVPNKADITKLTTRVEELTRMVQKLSAGKASVSAKAAPAAKPAAVKPMTRKSAAKKPAARKATAK